MGIVMRVWVDDSDGLVFIGEVLDCQLGEDVKGSVSGDTGGSAGMSEYPCERLE
jgi:hypothetical protein